VVKVRLHSTGAPRRARYALSLPKGAAFRLAALGHLLQGSTTAGLIPRRTVHLAGRGIDHDGLGATLGFTTDG